MFSLFLTIQLMSAVWPVQNLSGVRCGPYQPGLRADNVEMVLMFAKCGQLDAPTVEALRANGFEPRKGGLSGDWIKRWSRELYDYFRLLCHDDILAEAIDRAVSRTLASLEESIAAQRVRALAAAKPELFRLD